MTKNLNIYDINGDVKGTYELNDSYIELEKGSQVVHDAVVAYLAGRRAGTASTKTRSEVSGGGAKPWRQKGTGRARAGSNRSPIWRHGGVIFGPKPRSYAKKMNSKALKLALKRAFSERVKEESVLIIDASDFSDHKTKSLKKIFSNLKLDENNLIVVNEISENIDKASRNLKKTGIVKAKNVNTYEMLLHKKVVFMKDSLDEFLKRIA